MGVRAAQCDPGEGPGAGGQGHGRRQAGAGRPEDRPGVRPRAAHLVGRGDARHRPAAGRAHDAVLAQPLHLVGPEGALCAGDVLAERSVPPRGAGQFRDAAARGDARSRYADLSRRRALGGAAAQREFRPRAARAVHAGRGSLQRVRHQECRARLHRLDDRSRDRTLPYQRAVPRRRREDFPRPDRPLLRRRHRPDFAEPAPHGRDDRREAVARVRVAEARPVRGQAAGCHVPQRRPRSATAATR